MTRPAWIAVVLLIAAVTFFTGMAMKGKGALDGLVILYAFVALILFGVFIAAEGIRASRRKIRHAEGEIENR